MKQISSALGRSLDPSYPPHIAIVTLTILGAIIAAVTGQPIIAIAGGVFLAWAIGREIDPDFPLSAFIGSVLVIGTAFIVEQQPDIAHLFGLLIALRIVNRIVGLNVTNVETGIVVIGGAILMAFTKHWGLGLIITLAFIIDSQIAPKHSLHVAAAIVMALITMSYAVSDVIQPIDLPSDYLIVGIIISILFAITIAKTQRIITLTDFKRKSVSVRRMQAAMALALLAAWLGGINAYPIWLTLFGTALYRAYQSTRPPSLRVV